MFLSGEPMRDLENIAASMSAALIPSLQYSASANKRHMANAAAANNSDDEDSKKAKTMDIYKVRQYKKLNQKH